MKDIDSRLIDYSPEYREDDPVETTHFKPVDTGYRVIYTQGRPSARDPETGEWKFTDE